MKALMPTSPFAECPGPARGGGSKRNAQVRSEKWLDQVERSIAAVPFIKHGEECCLRLVCDSLDAGQTNSSDPFKQP